MHVSVVVMAFWQSSKAAHENGRRVALSVLVKVPIRRCQLLLAGTLAGAGAAADGLAHLEAL
jgi:hypothetical protein